MKKFIIMLLVFAVMVGILSGCEKPMVSTGSEDGLAAQKNIASNYTAKQEVEDTCRSMQASYESDKQIYEQYKDSENEEKLSWADAVKMRANRAAAVYNQYILKNSFVWSGNVPSDIRSELPYIE